jgi:hypothetical protein
MQGKKLIILFLALLLPICIFLFLKMFGKNQFDVEPLFQDSVARVSVNCNMQYAPPYRIPDEEMKKIAQGRSASLYLLNLSKDKSVIQRVESEVGLSQVAILSDSLLSVRYPDQAYLRECILLLAPPNNIALVDGQNRIRGHYDEHDREDVDRLLVEMNIILKKY